MSVSRDAKCIICSGRENSAQLKYPVPNDIKLYGDLKKEVVELHNFNWDKFEHDSYGSFYKCMNCGINLSWINYDKKGFWIFSWFQSKSCNEILLESVLT